MILLRLIIESFSLSINALRGNKLRTILSLLGITIGIFAIISVFTVIDSLEKYMRESLNSLGSNMVYVQKWPWTPPEGETEYPWWKYLNRPIPKEEDADEILRRSSSTELATFFVVFNTTIQFGSSSAENAEIMASTYDLVNLWNLDINGGRYFTQSEMDSGAPMAVIGAELADKLFEGVDPVGKSIKVKGRRVLIVGTYARKGTDMFGTSMDKRLHVSTNLASSMVDFRNREMGQTINVKAKDDVDNDLFVSELEGILRSLHQLRPMEESDFAINEVSVISTRFDAFFLVFNIAGTVIGGFSILVGGFGIANIMFVSVKERTRIIGIQKSLGAKRYFILLQFIFEAVILSLIGGLIGLVLVFVGSELVSSVSEMHLVLSLKNIGMGLLVSGFIGLIAGYVPAWIASRLDPVVAINAG
ncbi:ABC transporter permease [Mangrovibacterium lignilyticum]|uniref:ABC transporter permease n=1 Tax=Mangrovibacterium lignilyticum TaxID=2668052 RepID=UPI0013D70BC5|nr:ABC transporter permease [Mangrovibacterium lignilyticum]